MPGLLRGDQRLPWRGSALPPGLASDSPGSVGVKVLEGSLPSLPAVLATGPSGGWGSGAGSGPPRRGRVGAQIPFRAPSVALISLWPKEKGVRQGASGAPSCTLGATDSGAGGRRGPWGDVCARG